MGHFISATVLRDMVKNGKNIILEEDSILTPSAKDLAKELGITIMKGKHEIVSPNTYPNVRSSASAGQAEVKELEASSTGAMTSDELKKTVQRILGEALKPACEHPIATHIKGDRVVIQPFDQAPPGQKIGLTDVITAREGNLCSGFMTFDHSKLPWFLNYDEVDYIIEGDFVLEVDNKVFRAKAGDVVYIPKGSQVIFSSPTFCKVFYVTYPANWADFCE